ncbi:hypothetical protein EES38_07130 [Vibrio viridaestus]|uniref:Uncharacterized protein n=1 Tax=Vibrio viridaestus TaxID=2487322 RepID=A0A3N9TK49_9VIBR|nr:hypothetical protein EES38_07130 [Vibrio viridaestus]
MIENDYPNEVYSKRDWLKNLLNRSEQQLLGLYGIKEKEKFKTMFSLVFLILSFSLLLLTLFVLIHPNGSILVNPEIHQFLGPICVFLGYFLFKSSSSFYEHRAILRQVSEYIYQQRKAVDRAAEALHYSEERLNEKRY